MKCQSSQSLYLEAERCHPEMSVRKQVLQGGARTISEGADISLGPEPVDPLLAQALHLLVLQAPLNFIPHFTQWLDVSGMPVFQKEQKKGLTCLNHPAVFTEF